MGSRPACWLGATGLLLFAVPVRALDAAPPPSSPSSVRAADPPLVNVFVVGSELGSSFAGRVQSWFSGRTRVDFVSAPALRADVILSPKPPDVVEVWLDVRVQNAAHVYLVVSGPTGERCLLRDVELAQGLDELGREQLAQVIYSAVLAVWEGRDQSARGELERRLGVTPAVASDSKHGSPIRSPVAPRFAKGETDARRAARASNGTSVYGGYGASWRGEERLAHGPELWGTLWERHGATRLGGLAVARYLLPVHARADDITLTLTGARLQIGVSAERELGEAFRAAAGASLGAVWVHYRPEVRGNASPSLHAASDEWELRPVAGVFVAVTARVGPVELALVPELDLPLTRTRYAVSQRGTLLSLFEPWMVQPGLAVLGGWSTPHP
jgi:hypothetical protein